jgi:hypothetical protein
MEKRQYRFWTDENVKFLLENFTNMSYEEIAEKTGHPRSSVVGMAYKLGLYKFRHFKPSKDFQNIYFKLKAEGKTNEDIAGELKIHPRTLTRVLNKVGIKEYFSPREMVNYDWLTTEDACYLAGLIDGDGTITITKRYDRRKGRKPDYFTYLPTVLISNTNKKIVSYVATILHKHYNPNGIKKTARSKLIYVVGIYSIEKIAGLLKRIIPYLHGKRERAELLLSYCEERMKSLQKVYRSKTTRCPYTQREVELAEKLRETNKREGHYYEGASIRA